MLQRPYHGSRRSAPALAFAFALALPLVAHAAGRTWVASTGNDGNAGAGCPETSPCQTFAVAYGATTAGGEIVALDAGGYGPLTITNSITIIAVQRAFIKPTAGTTGVTINAGSGHTVVLDNIEVNGAGGASTTGIAFNSGNLLLKDSVLTGLTTGLTIAANQKADIVHSQILSNLTGISTTGTGTDPQGSFGATQARIYDSTIMYNNTAFFMTNPGVSSNTNISDVTILVFAPNGVNTTRIAANSALVNGSGTGCPSGSDNNGVDRCDHYITFSSPTAITQGP